MLKRETGAERTREESWEVLGQGSGGRSPTRDPDGPTHRLRGCFSSSAPGAAGPLDGARSEKVPGTGAVPALLRVPAAGPGISVPREAVANGGGSGWDERLAALIRGSGIRGR